MVKQFNFQQRDEYNKKRDMIKTAYTITRTGKYGKGVLPIIANKVEKINEEKSPKSQ